MTAARVDGVYLDGSALRAALYAVNFTRERLRIERGQNSQALDTLARVMSESPHADTSEGTPLHTDGSAPFNRLTVGQVARQLGMSERHVRRIARRLGGHLAGGRWLIPAEAVDQHMAGATE